MSGDAAGILLGIALLVGALPVILTTVAAASAAVGAVRLGAAAVRAAVDHHRKTKLEVDSCSAELSGLYAQLNEAMERQDQLSDAYFERVQGEMEALEAQTRQSLVDLQGQNEQAAEQLLRDVREKTSQALGERRRAEFARIRTETEQQTARIVAQIQTAQQVRVEAADWAQQTEAAKAQQTALAQDLLRDAEASLRLLRTMARSDGEPTFVAKVEAVARTYDTAASALQSGMLQVAATSAQQVITRSATLALEHEQQRSERDQARAAVVGLLEGLRAEMAEQEWIEFEDEDFGHVEEHLDDFTQGAFSAVVEEIDERLQWLASDDAAFLSPEELDVEVARVEDDLFPRADQTLRLGRAMLQSFYERLHALHELQGFMAEQGYVCDWQQMAGGDATQKAVAHFVDQTTGNSIVVSLDDEDALSEVDRMAMEVMFHYGSGHPVSEEQKEQMRAGMLEALRREGVGGSLACTGQVGASSADVTLTTQTSVEQLPVEPLQ